MNSYLKDHEIRRCRPLLGTFVEIAIESDNNLQAHAAINAAFAEVERIQKLMSFHDAMSEVSRLNRLAACERVSVSFETYQVLKSSKELYEMTQGVFDIAVGSELVNQGVLPRHHFLDESSQGRTSDIELLPGNFIRFLQPLCIDLGGIAKGFAVDQAVKVLQNQNMENGLVNAGGDMRMFGEMEQPVWISHSAEFEKFISSRIFLKNAAVATSSVRTDFFIPENLTAALHLQMPSKKIFNEQKTAAVIAKNCLLADALTKVVLLAAEDVIQKCLTCYQAKALVFGGHGQDVREIN